MSSGKRLISVAIPACNSLICIKRRSDERLISWGTPGVTFEAWFSSCYYTWIVMLSWESSESSIGYVSEDLVGKAQAVGDYKERGRGSFFVFVFQKYRKMASVWWLSSTSSWEPRVNSASGVAHKNAFVKHVVDVWKEKLITFWGAAMWEQITCFMICKQH